MFLLTCIASLLLVFLTRSTTADAHRHGNNPSQPPFPTWTYHAPNQRMDWNELPSHVHLTTTDVTKEPVRHDVLIVGTSNSTNATDVARLNDSDGNEQSLTPLLRILQEKVKDSSAGTLSSSILRVLSDDNDDSCPQQQVYCVQMGNTTTKKSARGLGTALATAVTKRHESVASIRVVLPEQLSLDCWTELAASFWEALYKDERYKSIQSDDERKKDAISKRTIRVELTPADTHKNNEPQVDTVEAALARGASLARGVYLTKDIVNAPHNILNALSLAETAQKLCRLYPGLYCQVLSADDCERLGMGAFLGVARASETPAQFIHITYRAPSSGWFGGSKKQPQKLGIVGKGLLFDTGGYNIKTSMMELMKFDCGGAAAVLGAVRAIAELQPAGVEVHFCIAACENMINERGMVGGDVLTAMNGKTIEVINTDAEGRLTMADALVYVDRELNCDEVVELSTLTGACMVALGSSVAGMWTANEKLAASLETAATAANEQIWRMPLVEDYKEQLKSKIADLKNLGSRGGGAITAALFLQNFVTKPYAHIDMAGPVWSNSKSQATGWGAKLLTEWVDLRSRASNDDE